MATFQYKALQAEGGVTDGRIEAGGRQEAFRLIEARGLKLISLAEANGAAAGAKGSATSIFNMKIGGKGRIKFNDLENFIRQLSGLLAAGVPLSRALKLLSREASTEAARERWKAIHDSVIDGTSLADSMARYPDTFPQVHIAMVQAGELGGFLDVVLAQIAEFQTREKELRGKVTSALVYPAVLLCLAIGVLIFLLTFFIPRFQAMFESMGGALPWITRLIMSASYTVRHYGIFVAVGIVAIVVLTRRWLKTEQGRRVWERAMLKMPIIGPMVARFALARFARMLGTLLGAGVPLINALKTACESIGNQGLMDAVRRSIERVRQGDRLGTSLADRPELFPSSVLEVVSVAEETARLDKELVRLATTTEADLERMLRMAVALAEPALLFLMAAFIGTIFVGMVLPIFTIQDLIK